MKLHLPITLLTAVLAAVIALPAQAVEAPKGYTTTYLNSSGTLENYSSLTEEDYIAFILGSSLEFTPTSNDYWTDSTPLISGGNVFFSSDNSDSPVALSFKDGYGPAFSGQSALTFDTLSKLTFSMIEGEGEQSAIVLAKLCSLTISNNGVVAFSDNYSYVGGAINTDDCDITINNNGVVTFSDNYATHYGGGAINAGKGVTISYNNDVSFSGNNSSRLGGAIWSPDDITISHNGDVSFSGNYTTSMSGGAISAESGYNNRLGGNISLCGNESLTFDDNTALLKGGAIYSDDGIITISDNELVSFQRNSAGRSGGRSGGAICSDDIGVTVTISNNGDVTFSGNSASFGGAIYATDALSIQGNNSVLFEKNYENNNSVYRLRSIYGSANLYLSAKTGGDITFYDSVYTSDDVYFNSDYTDTEGSIQSAKGDIIFSGKYAEQHLNDILAANNEGRTATAEEILNSQTSEIQGNVYVNGGNVQIVDGAVLKVGGDTVSIAEGSEATLAISDAELVAENATIEVGASATLQLSNGGSVTADEIRIKAGATLALGDVAMTTSPIDPMVVAYRLSSLNVINADLTFAAGSTLVTDDAGASMTEGSILTFNATSDGEKINLVFTLGTEYSEDGLVQLFSNVDIVKFLMDGEEVDSSTTLLASDFFTGAGINENTTLHYDSTTNVV